MQIISDSNEIKIVLEVDERAGWERETSSTRKVCGAQKCTRRTEEWKKLKKRRRDREIEREERR